MQAIEHRDKHDMQSAASHCPPSTVARAEVQALRSSKIREVANAGMDRKDILPFWFGEPDEETPDEIWSETFSVNVDGVFRICRAAIPVLRDGGAIVNMGSVNSISPRTNAAAYCASKAALLQLTRSLALELAPRQIRVNCVCPGIVDTPLTDLFLNQSDDPDTLRLEYERSNPLQRMADPAEIASSVLFLASDESRFITGTSLVVDGGALAGD